MDSSQEDTKQSELSKLKWSSEYFSVTELLKKFPLPQIVKLDGGFYGDSDESTLSANQVLCLHSIKTIEKVHGRDSSGKEISILLECKDKVEVRPTNLKDVYESVEELCSVFPGHVRVSQGYYCLAKDEELLSVGDKLYLKNIDQSKNGEKKLICVNQNWQTIELPQDCVAGFQPLADGKEYYLAEIITQFPMPVNVQFVEPYSIGKQTRSEDKSLCQPLPIGTLSLDRTFKEKVIIATSIRDGKRTMVNFSPDTEISLGVCEDMLQKSPKYVNLCRSFNQDIDVKNINSDHVYEYIDDDENIEEQVKNITGPSGSKSARKKLPNSKNQPKPVPKPRSKNPTSKNNIKSTEKLNTFLRAHSFSTSKEKQSDQTNQPIYTEPNVVSVDIERENAESKSDPVYSELDATYISTDNHEYEKPLKQGEHLYESNPKVLGGKSPKSSRPEKSSATYTNGKPSLYTELDSTYISTNNNEYEKPLKQAEHLHQLKPVIPTLLSSKLSSIQSEKSRSNSCSNGKRNPPLIPDRPFSKPKRFSMPENPQLSDNLIALSDSTSPFPTKSQVPGKVGTDRKEKPILPNRKPAKPVPEGKTASPDSLLRLPTKPEIHNNSPERSILPDRKLKAADELLPIPNKSVPKSVTASPDNPQQLPESTPLVPIKPKIPDNLPDRPILLARKPTTPDQLLPVPNKPESITATPDNHTMPENLPVTLNSPPDQTPSLSKKPAVTPEREEIYQALAKYPSDLTGLTITGVSGLLKYLGMESHVRQFQSELIDGEMLVSMDAGSLESLNISSFYVKKLLKFIGGWRPTLYCST